MATTKFGEIELDDTELAQMSKTAFETLGPLARFHDLPSVRLNKTEAATVDRELAGAAAMIIADFMAKGGSSKKVTRAK
jgi:hypothetical protein